MWLVAISGVVFAALLAGWQQAADGKGWLLVALGAGLAVAGLVVPLALDWLVASRAEGVGALEAGEGELRRRLLVAYAEQERRLGVSASVPLTVRFSSTGRPAAGRAAVAGRDGDPAGLGGWQSFPLRGDVHQIAAVWREEVPRRQLVVLGEPGAGKTALVLALARRLLETPQAGEPVPVLMPMSSWDPGKETLEHFAAGSLVASGLGSHLAERLVGEPRLTAGSVPGWWVMPVMDGLDELPEKLRVQAMAGLEEFASYGRPVVVTCRSQEYSQIMAVPSRVLPRAAVIEIQPVTPDDVAGYLSHPEPDRPRWEPVLRKLSDEPEGPLARALSTPLMAALARSSYQQDGTSPAELTTLPSRGQITRHLISRYIDVAYDPSRSVLIQNGKPIKSYPPGRPQRWLETLAYLLSLTGSRDLMWWRLPVDQIVARPARAARWRAGGFAVVAVVASASVTALFTETESAARAALATAMVLVLSWFDWARPLPDLGGWEEPVEPVPAQVSRLIRALRELVCGAIAAMVCPAPLLAAATGLIVASLGLLRTESPGVLASLEWRPGPRAAHRRAALAAVREGTWAAVLCVIIATAFGYPAAVLPGLAVPVAVVFAAAAGLRYGWKAWIYFRLAHLHLVLQGRIPLFLPAFLRDAGNRGVLRRNGAVWQLRHALIQDHVHQPAREYHLHLDAAAGNWRAGRELAGLLRDRGDVDGLRDLAAIGDRGASGELAGLLRERGHVAELRDLAVAGNERAVWELARLLRERGDVDGLRDLAARDLASATGMGAGGELAGLLRERGDVDGLRDLNATGDRHAGLELAGLLRERGDVDAAIVLLQRRAYEGDSSAAEQLAALLRERDEPS